jgi:hypothetical protein
MTNEVVQTKTKYKILTDRVYASPVDQYEVQARRKIGIILVGVIALFLVIVFLV